MLNFSAGPPFVPDSHLPSAVLVLQCWGKHTHITYTHVCAGMYACTCTHTSQANISWPHSLLILRPSSNYLLAHSNQIQNIFTKKKKKKVFTWFSCLHPCGEKQAFFTDKAEAPDSSTTAPKALTSSALAGSVSHPNYSSFKNQLITPPPGRLPWSCGSERE